MKRAAIYARVSTKKEEQKLSVGHQLSTCRAFCEARGWRVAGEFSDERTGRTFARRGWQSLMDEVSAGQVDVIVATARDRIARNKLEAGRLRLEVLPLYNVTIEPVAGMGDSTDPGIELAISVQEAFDDHLSRLIGWKTRNGQDRRLADGYWPFRTPFGCMKDPRNKGVPIKDPAGWPMLEHAYALAAEGCSLGEVRRWLEEQGVPSAAGGGWNLSSVSRMLQNKFYIGEYDRGGEVHKLRHACLLDPALWWQAQRDNSFIRYCGRPRGEQSPYCYLTPRVVCSHYSIASPAHRSGNPLPFYARYTVGRGGVCYPYYYRADRLNAGAGIRAESADGTPLSGAGSVRSGIRADHLDYLVLRQLAALGGNGSLLDYELRTTAQLRSGQLEAEREDLVRRIARTEREWRRTQRALIKLATAANIGETLLALDAQARELRLRLSEQSKLLNRIDAELVLLDGSEPHIRRAVSHINAIHALYDAHAWDELRAVLDLLVDHVDIRLDGPLLVLKPVMKTSAQAALTGGFVLPLSVPSRLIAA